MKFKRQDMQCRLLGGVFAALLLTIFSVAANASGNLTSVDVAMNGLTFFDFEDNPGNPGVPPNGSPFIIQGYIYPGGTFDKHGNLSGVNADGSPEFPDRVIGTWICRGWHLQDGDAFTGPVVATTQIFDFSKSQAGTHTIVTDGIELADLGVPFNRAITGGTGIFQRVGGDMRQTYVWDDPDYLNASGGFNTSFNFHFRQPMSGGDLPAWLKGEQGKN